MCDNPNHDHEHENLLELISKLNEPEEIASVAIQIFCAISTTLVEAGLPNPVIFSGFDPMKLLAERLKSQELTDIVITTEMEHAEAIGKMIAKTRHPSQFTKRQKRKDKN